MGIFDGIRRFFDGGNGAAAPPPPPDEPGGEMITCQEALTFIHELLDGELEGVTQQKVERHFEVCGRCYPQLKLEEAYRAALRRCRDGQTAPDELKDRVRALLADAAGE